jgi:GDP-L-fucose synthase
MRKTSKIYVAGHTGMVGSALMRELGRLGYTNVVVPDHRIDLRNQEQVDYFMKMERPEFIFMCAAKVGGIKANNAYRAEFIADNLMMQTNVIDSAHKWNVTKLMFLGSSCVYPRNCTQPIVEDYLLSGYLDPTNEPYAVAKIAGLKMVESYRKQYGCDFISLMPCNLYGPGDNFNIEDGHVIPALMMKMMNYDVLNVWGSGRAMREFMHVDDLAKAMIYFMRGYSDDSILNVGTGREYSIIELIEIMAEVVGFSGRISYDRSFYEGPTRKVLDVSRANAMGWMAQIDIYKGLEDTFRWLSLNHGVGKVRV